MTTTNDKLRIITNQLLSNECKVNDDSLRPLKVTFHSSGRVEAWWNGGKHKAVLNPMMARHLRGFFEEQLRRLYLLDQGVEPTYRVFRRLRFLSDPFDHRKTPPQHESLAGAGEIQVLPFGKSGGMAGSYKGFVLPIDVAVQIARTMRQGDEMENQYDEGEEQSWTCFTETYEQCEAIDWEAGSL